MKKHNLDYQSAYELVKSKRRFVQPNSGFIAQLKLWHRMGCTIDTQYQKYKTYRLRLAGDQVRKGKKAVYNIYSLSRKCLCTNSEEYSCHIHFLYHSLVRPAKTALIKAHPNR